MAVSTLVPRKGNDTLLTPKMRGVSNLISESDRRIVELETYFNLHAVVVAVNGPALHLVS